MIVLLSGVLMIVLNSWISLTVPVCPCASMKSPTWNGLNIRIITPPAKFCNVPLNAMPIARPADAKIATNDVVSIPRMLMIVIIRNSVSEMLTRLIRKLLSEASTSRLVSILRRMFFR